MKSEYDFKKIAGAFYNKGLERALLADLTGAAHFLRESLLWDKYMTDARNLLGLIFYHTGETADALAQWVISVNLDPKDNDAYAYLEEVQKKPGALSEATTLVRRFNQALYVAQNGGEDFARVELRDILKKKPGYLRAHLLLALLDMEASDDMRALKELSYVLETDRNHPDAVRYIEALREKGVKPEKEKRSYESAPAESGRTQGTVAKGFMDNGRIVLLLCLGIALGLLAFYILVLPAVKKEYVNELNNDIIENSRELSELNDDYSSLSESYSELLTDYNDVSRRLEAYEQENLDFTSAYRTLSSIISDCGSGEYLSAADDYISLNRENITEEPLTQMLAEADRVMLTEAFAAIEQMGTDAWNSGQRESAESYYRLALEVKQGDPEAMYLLARLLQSEDRMSEANEIFDKIVGEHPESVYAERAVTARGY